MTLLKGIKLSTFLSTHQEWHALVIGFSEVLCPWPPRHKSMHSKLKRQISSEYHYYVFGRAVAILAWLFICFVIKVTLF